MRLFSWVVIKKIRPMKKTILTSLAVISCAFLSQAQGLISLQETTTGTVFTNGPVLGEGNGPVSKSPSSYYYDVLDMTAASWAGLTPAQQAGAQNLLANPSDVALWTDSGVTGINATLTGGGISGLGGTTGTTAANWAAPTDNTYDSAPSYDYYMVVGWSANEGTSWSTVGDEIENDSFPAIGWYGETQVMYNYAGGGPDNVAAPNVFSSSSFTGLAGSGSGATNPELTLEPVVPEPTTLALAGLAGLSVIFLHRRK
jgi:hypothetical protein